METAISAPALIHKEDISSMRFPSSDVLYDPVEIRNRRNSLERATTLGNIERRKSKIIFEDEGGIKMVETTIWATTKDNIVLKQGVTVPINRIHGVNFY